MRSIQYKRLLSVRIFLVAAFAILPMKAFSASKAEQLLTHDLTPAIKTLRSEVRLYHYFGLNLNGYNIEDTLLNQNKERYKIVKNRLEVFANTFWDLNNHSTKLANAGLGLYLAVDPFASSPEAASETGANFGSTLMEVTLNAGTKYLDLMDAVQLREETINAIVQETKMPQTEYKKLFQGRKKGFYRNTLQYMADSQNTAFRKIVLSVFSQQGIAMTEYGWQAATSGFCSTAMGKGKIHHSALVFVGGPRTQNAIKSITMVLREAGHLSLDQQERESFIRNRKFHGLLQLLRPLEKQFQVAAKNDDRKLMKQLSTQMKATIDYNYNNQFDLQDLRTKTFGCTP